jgi:hypothetical protein
MHRLTACARRTSSKCSSVLPSSAPGLAERAEEHQPRAVDEYVAPPEAAGDLAHQQRDAAGRAEVALYRERLPPGVPDRDDGLGRGM